MKTYIFQNVKTLETKPSIKSLSFVLAEEYFETTYWFTNSDWKTIEL